MNNEKVKKIDNNGFSLVELIIVIAIMAVLIGVLAPQYLKYVEKSRVSTDLDNVDTIVSALQVYAADPDATAAFKGGETITIDRSGTKLAEKDATGKPVAKALEEANIKETSKDTVSLNLKNKSTVKEVVITITVSDGKTSISAAYTGEGGKSYDPATGKESS